MIYYFKVLFVDNSCSISSLNLDSTHWVISIVVGKLNPPKLILGCLSAVTFLCTDKFVTFVSFVDKGNIL